VKHLETVLNDMTLYTSPIEGNEDDCENTLWTKLCLWGNFTSVSFVIE